MTCHFCSIHYAFLSYSNLHKGYKCLDISSGCVYISHDVVFDENIFPFANLHPNARVRCTADVLLLPPSTDRTNSDLPMNNSPANPGLLQQKSVTTTTCAGIVDPASTYRSGTRILLGIESVYDHRGGIEIDAVLDCHRPPCSCRGLYSSTALTQSTGGLDSRSLITTAPDQDCCIESYSRPGACILDCCSGSCTHGSKCSAHPTSSWHHQTKNLH
jgi:hypothetical protein